MSAQTQLPRRTTIVTYISGCINKSWIQLDSIDHVHSVVEDCGQWILRRYSLVGKNSKDLSLLVWYYSFWYYYVFVCNCLQVRLVDAGFVWTEPHSKRIKVKLTIQKEVRWQKRLTENAIVLIWHVCFYSKSHKYSASKSVVLAPRICCRRITNIICFLIEYDVAFYIVITFSAPSVLTFLCCIYMSCCYCFTGVEWYDVTASVYCWVCCPESDVWRLSSYRS